MSENFVKVKRALISVSDKSGVVDFARTLSSMGVEIISTGGTAAVLRDAGIELSDVSALTQFPEILNGRVKTLHPLVHGGLLSVRDDPLHLKEMNELGILEIDLLVVNLYPFDEMVIKGEKFDKCIENIDVGGPAMIRAAAKNFKYLSVITESADYPDCISELQKNKCSTSEKFRSKMAQIAFSLTASYDALVSSWMAAKFGTLHPRHFVISGRLKDRLRYGENPHQKAAIYSSGLKIGKQQKFEQLQGKELSYNNIVDLESAHEIVSAFGYSCDPTAVIVKHTNPCGIAQAAKVSEAFEAAFNCDSISAFGGIVALNRDVDEETAAIIIKNFTEIVVAPGFSPGSIKLFAAKKNIRLIRVNSVLNNLIENNLISSVSEGFLVQERNRFILPEAKYKIVSARQPSVRELNDLMFSWVVVKFVKSNAVVFAKNLATVGIGAGQMSRVESTKIAHQKSVEMSKAQSLKNSMSLGAVAASDAFFPFKDGIEAIYDAGVTAIIQPGGSLRDPEIIKTADKLGLCMVFTEMRHFLH